MKHKMASKIGARKLQVEGIHWGLLWKWQTRFASIVIVAIITVQLVDSLAFTSIQMPALVQRGTNFWLACQYELSTSSPLLSSGHRPTRAQDSLYSVKWYKNNEEFYRVLFTNQQNAASFTGAGNNRIGTLDNNGQPGLDNSSMSGQQFDGKHQFQQQYFSLAGVNVLMSSSNATHVRLLNASLDSDGSYACEISTENLSTIRHEKEIKVYVLPKMKINVVGVKSLYSLGERIELNCLSDFSRPIGALAWFINGRQITENLGPFELSSSIKPKANEPQLARASLVLKFTLTSEILLAFTKNGTNQSAEIPSTTLNRATATATATTTTTTTTTVTQQQHRNQSLKSLSVTGLGGSDESQSLLSVGQPATLLFELFKLECMYKLTDVSDVTFNELKIARAATGSAADQQLDGPASDHQDDKPYFAPPAAKLNNYASETSGELGEQSRYRRHHHCGSDSHCLLSARRRRNSFSGNRDRQARNRSAVAVTRWPPRGQHLTQTGQLKLSRSHGNQVIQSTCPAGRAQFYSQVFEQPPGVDACALGLLALQQDDPIIVEAVDLEPRADEDTEMGSNSGLGIVGELRDDENSGLPGLNKARLPGTPLELPEGALLQLNCSTMGALLDRRDTLHQSASYTGHTQAPPVMVDDYRRDEEAEIDFGSGAGELSSDGLWPMSPQARRRQSLNMAMSHVQYRQHYQRKQSDNFIGSIAANYCNDSMAHRRALISGKYQVQPANEEAAHSAPNQRSAKNHHMASSSLSPSLGPRHQQRNQQFAYIQLKPNGALNGDTNNGGEYDEAAIDRQLSSPRRRFAPVNQSASADSAFLAAESLAQLEQLHQHHHHHRHHNHHYYQQQQQRNHQEFRAPPLLEWFINNREAPKSSASYVPELPLTLAASPSSLAEVVGSNMRRRALTQTGGAGPPVGDEGDGEDKGFNDDKQSRPLSETLVSDSAAKRPVPPSGESAMEDESTQMLPSIDYAQYFANFDARTVDQHLKLSLKLDKKHFTTPDSFLTLRCTSTQAQVLSLDSFTVTFLAMRPAMQTTGSGLEGETSRIRERKQQNGQTHWQQRTVTASVSNNQIKQKYLHQYPRSSGQRLSANSHEGVQMRREQNGNTNQLAALAKSVASKSTPATYLVAFMLSVSALANNFRWLGSQGNTLYGQQ